MSYFEPNGQEKVRGFDREWNLAVSASLERFANATVEHLVAHPALEKIAASKINPDPVHAGNNYHQQAGYSAEVKSVARTNADAIVMGKQRRVARTDDLGMVNHPVYDQVDIDANGSPLRASDGSFMHGAQLKVHKNIEGYSDLYGTNFEKYRSAKLSVPSDQIADIRADWNKRLLDLEEQRAALQKLDKPDVLKAKDAEIERLRNAEARLQDSGVSTRDSMEARKNPILSTTKDVLRLSHKAGLEGAKSGVVFGGGFSAIRNLIAVGRGRKKGGEALAEVASDTGMAALTSYATSATASAMGGALKSTSSQVCQNLAKGSGPAAVLQVGVIISTHVVHLVGGRITHEQFIQGVSREGATLASSLTGANLGAVLGTMVMPGVGTLVGGVVGGMIASLMCGVVYSELQKSLALTELSRERRKAIEQVCRGLVEQERLYRSQIVEVFDEFYAGKEAEINTGFGSIAIAMQCGESIEPGLRRIGGALGFELQFASDEDFSQHLKSGEALIL
jgi:hypothetical protein